MLNPPFVICPNLTRDNLSQRDASVPCSQGQAALFGKEPQEISPAALFGGPQPRWGCAGDFLGKEPEKQSREDPPGAGKALSG